METKRAKKVRTTLRRVYIVAACLAVSAILAGGALLGYDHLRIREINFYGNRHLTYEELLSFTGCSQNSRLFSVSDSDIYRRLKANPWIKDAMVRKDLTGKVTVQITEAVAVAVLLADEKPYLVDRDGTRLEEIRQEPVYFLPVIKIDPASCREAYREAVVLAGILSDGKVAAHAGNIELSGSRPEEITMKIDNVPVRIGTGDLTKKLEKLDFVREELVRRNMDVEYIDLRFVDKIVVKPLRPAVKEPPKAVAKPVEDRKKPKQKTPKKKGSAKKATGGRSRSHVG